MFCRENRIASHFSGFEKATEARLERNTNSDLDLIFNRFFVIFFLMKFFGGIFVLVFFWIFWSAWRVSRRLKFLGWAKWSSVLWLFHYKKVDGFEDEWWFTWLDTGSNPDQNIFFISKTSKSKFKIHKFNKILQNPIFFRSLVWNGPINATMKDAAKLKRDYSAN